MSLGNKKHTEELEHKVCCDIVNLQIKNGAGIFQDLNPYVFFWVVVSVRRRDSRKVRGVL
jgi:hypothetical protein